MPSWPFWVFFFLSGVAAVALTRWLDDRDALREKKKDG
jgi:hypothetical protein